MNRDHIDRMAEQCAAHQKEARTAFDAAGKTVGMPPDLVDRFWNLAWKAGVSSGILETTKAVYEGAIEAQGKVALAMRANSHDGGKVN